MTKQMIRITRTQVVTYDPALADKDYYDDNAEYKNIDHCAIADKTGIEGGDFPIDDVADDNDLQETFSIEIVTLDQKGDVLASRPVDENNHKRDYDLFPETDEEAEEYDEDDSHTRPEGADQ